MQIICNNLFANYCKNEMIENMNEKYKKIIKEKGLSVTDKRISILETLDFMSKPITIELLKENVKIKMDTSTIYRSLKVLVDKGLVYQTDFRDGKSYFEFQGKNHHHHIVCTECKSRTLIDLCVNSGFGAVEEKTGYTVTNHIFELFGLCKKCR